VAAGNPRELLVQWRSGNRAALDALFPLVYEDLRSRARAQLRHQPDGHTLTTTALVHETYLKLIGVENVSWQDRSHFLALAATAMRHVLVSYARRNNALKRDPERNLIALDEAPVFSEASSNAVLRVDEALEKLAKIDERLARMVELRFFGGMTIEDTAQAMDVGLNTVKRDWARAKAWLKDELESQ
jgi:RNA polymerase sigma factor (TIGR02999 family)